MRKKVTVIGAGHVGTTTAQLIAERNLADVVLVDIIEGIPQGKALDIQEACPLWNSSVQVTGAHTYDATADSDIVVVTAGLARENLSRSYYHCRIKSHGCHGTTHSKIYRFLSQKNNRHGRST
jgi:malate/lactate dehydrogenase